MLVNNTIPFKENDTISIRLSTTEELVAKFIKQTDTHVTVQQALTLVVDQTGQVRPMPFIMGAEEKSQYDISKQHIIALVKTGTQLNADYIKITTGIQIPAGVKI